MNSYSWTSPSSRLKWVLGLFAAVGALAIADGCALAWTQIGDGFEYQKFTLPHPNNVFVVRMDRANPNCAIDSMVAGGTVSGARETVRDQVKRHDGAINTWSGRWERRNKAVAAINGDFFNPRTGVQTGGQILGGWYAHRFYEYGGTSGFVWTRDRETFIGDCVSHKREEQAARFGDDGPELKISRVNEPRQTNELVLYTPQFDATTKTSDNGVEALVRMNGPVGLTAPGLPARGTVIEVRNGKGSTPIPFDCVVLSAEGRDADALAKAASPGGKVTITQVLSTWEKDCETRRPLDWRRAYSCVGGNFTFLRDGRIVETDNRGLLIRNPRTAIAYNDRYAFFIVCDGRDPGVSVGMNMAELGAFCRDELKATWGTNQDGGGSSTLWINGRVVNKTSDGPERPVANGSIMVNLLPEVRSHRYAQGVQIALKNDAQLRLGPGANYAATATAAAGSAGRVSAHGLNGILGQGGHWWKVELAEGAGWVCEKDIRQAPVGPGESYSVFQDSH